jgi:pimeloyl-ACP methyl ester carboxylesterase
MSIFSWSRVAVAIGPAGGMAVSVTADSYLTNFDYPEPVQRYEFRSQGQQLFMAYMDVPSARPNGKTVLLMHGKNFCGATWEGAIGPLREAGYRVVIPDQIGFCKSSKPQAYQFGFHQLSANTHALLSRIGAVRPILVGHSMGGMLAVRYALDYPQDLSGLVLVNPIGLEDWKAKGVPMATVDQLYEHELKTTFDRSGDTSRPPTMSELGSRHTTAGSVC